MKPSYHKIPLTQENSFSIRHTVQPNFGTVWHYHPELELHYVIKGEGIRFIGDDISTFSAGELVLLGQNLPHMWQCHREYFNSHFHSGNQAEAVVIQFLPDFMGQSFLELPEARQMSRLFVKASKGLLLKGEPKEKVLSKMLALRDSEGLQRLVLLTQIIEKLATTEDYEIITSSDVFNRTTIADSNRLEKVYNYTLSNYKEDVRLEEVSELVNLSPSYFCRYFKQKTGKTYLDLLTEIRISHACLMLAEKEASVESICYECGYNNVTNFFKNFKRLKKMTPKAYREIYLSNQ